MDDPRLTPARGDLAAKYLEGKVKAARFVEGEEFEVVDAIAPLRGAASPVAAQLTQALRGERVTVYDRNGEGFCWAQLNSDGYVGWLPDRALAKPAAAPTHKVTRAANVCLSRSFDQAAADRRADDGRKSGGGARGRRLCDHAGRPMPAAAASPGALDANASRLRCGRRALCRHALSLGRQEQSWHRFLGLVQVSLTAAGTGCPATATCSGTARTGLSAREATRLKRGDLIFWKGHVAIARDAETIVHANAHHMATVIENTKETIARIKAAGSGVSAIKRL